MKVELIKPPPPPPPPPDRIVIELTRPEAELLVSLLCEPDALPGALKELLGHLYDTHKIQAWENTHDTGYFSANGSLTWRDGEF